MAPRVVGVVSKAWEANMGNQMQIVVEPVAAYMQTDSYFLLLFLFFFLVYSLFCLLLVILGDDETIRGSDYETTGL